MSRHHRLILTAAIVTLSVTIGPLRARGTARQSAAPSGSLERITVHGRSLEGNLEGDTPDRTVLPRSGRPTHPS